MQGMERRATADACRMTGRSVASSFAASPLFHAVSSSVLVTSTVRAILPIISLLSSIVSIISVVALLLRRPVMLVEGVAGLQ